MANNVKNFGYFDKAKNIDALTLPVDDGLGLARAMWRLHDDSNLPPQLSEPAQHDALQLSWEMILDVYITVYRTLITENSGGYIAKIQ